MATETNAAEIDLYDNIEDEDFGQDTNDISNEDLYDDVIAASSANDSANTETTSKTVPAPTSISANYTGKRVATYVGNLTWWTTDQDLMDAATAVSVEDVLEIKFHENRQNGQSKGFCVMVFGSDQSARTCMEKMPKLEIHSQAPMVTWCNKQNLHFFEQQSGGSSSQSGSGGTGGSSSGGGGGGGGGSNKRDNDRSNSNSRGPQGQGNMNRQGNPMQSGPNPMPHMQLRGPPMGMPPRNMHPGMMPGGPGMPPMGPQLIPGPPPPGHMPVSMAGGLPPGTIRMPPGVVGPPYGGAPPGILPPGLTFPPGAAWIRPLHGGPNPHINPSFLPASTQPGMAPPGAPGGPPNPGMPGAPPHSMPQPGMPGGPPGVPQFDAFGRQLPGFPPGGMNNPLQAAPGAKISEAEFEEILQRNKTVSSSAINRAVQDAASGDYASAIETLVTAISLIKQSKIANDDRCKILINSLQDTLHGIESKSYGSKGGRRRRRSYSDSGSEGDRMDHHVAEVDPYGGRTKDRSARSRSPRDRDRRDRRERERDYSRGDRSDYYGSSSNAAGGTSDRYRDRYRH